MYPNFLGVIWRGEKGEGRYDRCRCSERRSGDVLPRRGREKDRGWRVGDGGVGSMERVGS
jgi:hypothetical protein